MQVHGDMVDVKGVTCFDKEPFEAKGRNTFTSGF